MMRIIGLLACHSTELREDVPVIEVSWFHCTRISVSATTYKCSALILDCLSAYSFIFLFEHLKKKKNNNYSTRHIHSFKLHPRHFLVAQEVLCWIILMYWVVGDVFFKHVQLNCYFCLTYNIPYPTCTILEQDNICTNL